MRATLNGLDGPSGGVLVLAGGDSESAAAVSLAVPSGGEWSSDGVTLQAIPRYIDGLGWAMPVRNLSSGLAVVLLLGFAIVVLRRPRT